MPAAEKQASSSGYGMAVGAIFASIGIVVVIIIGVGVYLKMKKRSGEGQDGGLGPTESQASSVFSIGDMFSSSSVVSTMSVLPGEGHNRTVAFSSSSYG